MADEQLREWAESDEHLRWIVAHHTAPEGKDYCSDCSERFPCDMVSLAATGLTRSADLAAERERSKILENALKTIAKGVWIAKADACLDTIEFIAREGLRKAVQQAKDALAADDARRDGAEEG